VHQQTGAGIDFDNGAPLSGQGLGDVLSHQIDAGTENPCSPRIPTDPVSDMAA
jgi:hypothetical protein